MKSQQTPSLSLRHFGWLPVVFAFLVCTQGCEGIRQWQEEVSREVERRHQEAAAEKAEKEKAALLEQAMTVSDLWPEEEKLARLRINLLEVLSEIMDDYRNWQKGEGAEIKDPLATFATKKREFDDTVSKKISRGNSQYSGDTLAYSLFQRRNPSECSYHAWASSVWQQIPHYDVPSTKDWEAKGKELVAQRLLLRRLAIAALFANLDAIQRSEQLQRAQLQRGQLSERELAELAAFDSELRSRRLRFLDLVTRTPTHILTAEDMSVTYTNDFMIGAPASETWRAMPSLKRFVGDNIAAVKDFEQAKLLQAWLANVMPGYSLGGIAWRTVVDAEAKKALEAGNLAHFKEVCEVCPACKASTETLVFLGTTANRQFAYSVFDAIREQAEPNRFGGFTNPFAPYSYRERRKGLLGLGEEEFVNLVIAAQIGHLDYVKSNLGTLPHIDTMLEGQGDWEGKPLMLVDYALTGGQTEVADFLYDSGCRVPSFDEYRFWDRMLSPDAALRTTQWLIENKIATADKKAEANASTCFIAALASGQVEAAKRIYEQYKLTTPSTPVEDYFEWVDDCDKAAAMATFLCDIKAPYQNEKTGYSAIVELLSHASDRISKIRVRNAEIRGPFAEKPKEEVRSRSANLAAVKVLVEHGANVNLSSSPALFMAVECGDLELVQSMLEHGATLPCKQGNVDAVARATELGFTDIVRALRQAERKRAAQQ